MTTVKTVNTCQVQCINRYKGIFVPRTKNTLLFCNWNFNLNGCFEDVSNIWLNILVLIVLLAFGLIAPDLKASST